ncbi:MAG: hypothetical protein LQ347_001481 [Umbilicaria vellea]|nr:MAG: hypothetical protein LQ347_001481 [Umbilicaria vellea]
MASNATGGFEPPRQSRRFLRPNLRQATLILPQTGERVKRKVTLRQSDLFGDVNGARSPDNRSPLLGGQERRTREAGLSRRIRNGCEDFFGRTWMFVTSKTAKDVLKCSIAYFLGSLATFLPPIAAFLGHQDGKHMVATITVYFHPARSQGSMFEAILVATLAFVYAVFICFTSMGVSVLFGQIWNRIVLGHIVVLIVFCGGGLGFVGWIKQRLAKPLVNVACSLTSLAIITILTKEGAVQAATFSNEKVTQVLKMVVMGVLATTVVCFCVSPISARKELREDMISVTDSFADMLTMITRSFLTGVEEELQQPISTQVSDRYKAAIASLSKNLKEARFEHYVVGTEKEYDLESKMVKCMQRLAQNIGGLRSAAITQFNLLSQAAAAGTTTPTKSNGLAASMLSAQDEYGVLPAGEEHPEGGSPEGSSSSIRRRSMDSYQTLPLVNTPAEVFSSFITQLGPSMKSLAITLVDELPYGPSPDFRIAVNANFQTSLIEAVELYSAARKEALALLYKRKELNKNRPTEVEVEYEEVAASCGHFSYSLQDFAQEMKVYLEVLDELKQESEKAPRGRSWHWLRFWRSKRRLRSLGLNHSIDPEQDNLTHENEDHGVLGGLRSPVGRKGATAFDADKPPNPSYTYRLWKALGVFRRDDTKFAVKVGAGAALYALPSFVAASRPIYQHWRVLLTYNLTALYAYSLSVQDDDHDDDEGGVNPSIAEIALHRVVAVLSGCLWGLFVTRLVWPISARQKFKDGLSLLWLRMGLIWKRDPLATLLDGESTNAYMDLREEFELQRYLSGLETLRSNACSEFELRGPFRNAAYSSILSSTSRMLDAFHAMNVILMKDTVASKGEAEILEATVGERAQLCSRISHLFQVLASSMKLEFPLNDALPNTDHARHRLLAKIFSYRRKLKNEHETTDEDFALLYAYGEMPTSPLFKGQ